MEATNKIGILSEITSDNKTNGPEGIGVAEDSGFASIAGSMGSISDVSVKNDGVLAMAGDVKFRSINNVETTSERGAKRKIRETADADEKKKAAEEYNNEKREQVYKRLMHLLTKSQFYSQYIVDKINGNDAQTSKNKGKNKRSAKDGENDENEIPKQSQRVRKANKKYDMNQYVSTDMKKKLNAQKKKMNLSQEEIETELGDDSGTKNVEESSGDPGAAPSFVNPEYFDGTLRDYQIEGLQWLKVLYENGVNGILADEMGLGKTVQVIALYSHLLEKRQNGPYMIIAPLSTIPNWLIEFERFAPKLPVVLYHGKDRAAAARKMKRKHEIADGYSTYPIMLTTYEVPIVDKHFVSSFKWRYIVIDEGHRVKNPECQLLKVLNRCESMNRLLLTGTPLQNNLTELWSLLHFLLPEIFDDLAVFESWFDAKELQQYEGTEKVLKQEEEKQVLTTLREILKPFMLRRVKTDVCLDIPPKKELVVYAPLTVLQHDLYKAVIDRDLAYLSRIDEKPAVIENVGPTRPKRKCRLRKSCDTVYAEACRAMDNAAAADAAATSTIDDSYNCSDWDVSAASNPINRANEDDIISEWKQYANVTDRNKDFLIRLRFANRMPMYRQIVNHPFLLHCPLDNSGLPEISENLVKASGKLLVLDAMLKKLKQQGHKVLLFSTSTMLLDLIADYLTMRPWRFVMLDGRQDIALRQISIKEFNQNPELFLFLISTRAGGVGLNLASADTVIIYDSDWNPQCDLQAMARCHRIGQTRPVVVYRLCTKGTIDEQIIARAQAKRKLEKMVISKDNALDIKDTNKLKILKELLESTEAAVVEAEKEVYTDAELNKILDRSDLVNSESKDSD